VIYGQGSLYTSVIPCLVLPGVGEAISSLHHGGHKILILNGSLDRETSNMTAIDFVMAITNALNRYIVLHMHLCFCTCTLHDACMLSFAAIDMVN
jgi:2-phospho-L-lactate transferase/gluconeogenesis factor (CofD/UPF0052 family)